MLKDDASLFIEEPDTAAPKSSRSVGIPPLKHSSSLARSTTIDPTSAP
jgi:hypothetical protein